MAFGGGSKGGVKNDINITPLVDVVLVLLIIFMVITPMLQRGKAVNLPKAQKQEEDGKKSADPLVLSVTIDKQLFVESNAVTEVEMEHEVARELQKSPGRKILLKGDERLTVADVRKVMQAAQRGGSHGVALGIEELKK
jgi:biopolymer transport protein TolR